MKKKYLALLSLSLVCAVLLMGCNTIRGAGQDIQRAGSAIEDAVKKK